MEIPIRKTPMIATDLSHEELSHLLRLIQVLLPHPGGLRRWSVMRAIRSLHEKSALEVPLKFEDEIERVFRRHGGDGSGTVGSGPTSQLDAAARFFCRPKDRAGEVWAVDADKARAWLTTVERFGAKPRVDLGAMVS